MILEGGIIDARRECETHCVRIGERPGFGMRWSSASSMVSCVVARGGFRNRQASSRGCFNGRGELVAIRLTKRVCEERIAALC